MNNKIKLLINLAKRKLRIVGYTLRGSAEQNSLLAWKARLMDKDQEEKDKGFTLASDP